MKLFHDEVEQNHISHEVNLPKDFGAEELSILKILFLTIEKEIDNITLKTSGDKKSETFPGSYVFNILKKAEVCIVLLRSVITENETNFFKFHNSLPDHSY